MTAREIIPIAVAVIEAAASNKTIGKFVCGEYTDGSVRSMADAIRGEVDNPKGKKKKKHKKKKNKNKKHKKSVSSSYDRLQL